MPLPTCIPIYSLIRDPLLQSILQWDWPRLRLQIAIFCQYFTQIDSEGKYSGVGGFPIALWEEPPSFKPKLVKTAEQDPVDRLSASWPAKLVLQALRAFAVFWSFLCCGYCECRQISRFCTADTSGLAVFRGSLLWILLYCKFFGVMYCGYCKYWQYFVRWYCEYSQYQNTLNMPSILGV